MGKDKEKLLTKADVLSFFSSKEDNARLEGKISEAKAELLKWMIVLFAPFYVRMVVFSVKQFL